jgi:hypothetical protein
MVEDINDRFLVSMGVCRWGPMVDLQHHLHTSGEEEADGLHWHLLRCRPRVFIMDSGPIGVIDCKLQDQCMRKNYDASA